MNFMMKKERNSTSEFLSFFKYKIHSANEAFYKKLLLLKELAHVFRVFSPFVYECLHIRWKF